MRGSAWSGANLALRFALEVAAVVALVDWGRRATDSEGAGLLLGGGAGVAFVVVWALLVAPRSTRSPLDQRTRMLVGSALLLAVAAVAALGGRPLLGAVFAALVLANSAALWATQPEGSPLAGRGD
jgi:hypothetical protein